MAIIESAGAISLVQVGNDYFLYRVGESSGPQLRLFGAAAAAGQFGEWAPIGAEPIVGGFRIVWRNGSADQCTVWTTDDNGNYLSNGPVLSGFSATLEQLEANFGQDFNRDLTIGPVITTIESRGAVNLVQIGNDYFFGGISLPLKLGGVQASAGQFGAWTPLGVEYVAGEFQVIWKNGGADQYTVWNTDLNGNYLSNSSVMSGFSATLESLESIFDQDFNGDGTKGLVTTTIESFGSTALTQVGNSYFLYSVGGSSGPQLKLGGAAVTMGQFGGWTPIAAEGVTGGGYQIAWKNGGTDEYTVWTVDSNGGYLSSTANVAGNSLVLEALETGFHQDLNGDLTTGVVTTVIETLGSTRLVQVANTYSLYPLATSAGPQLRYDGAAVTVGQFGSWTAIGAEQTANGYEVAWKLTGADQYAVWFTDSAGNYLSNTAIVAGSNQVLQLLEPGFHQDLNGDGMSDGPQTTIESFGSTRLYLSGNNYFLDPPGGSPDRPLSVDGTPVTVGQFGAYTPIGAEQTAGGYQVAWKATGADQYTVWNADNSGNYLSATAPLFGSSSALEAYEPGFQQDLNNDGLIGVPASAFNIDVSYSGDPVYQSYFTAAAQRWQQVITGDLPGLVVPGYGFVDDLHITASVGAIDGLGGVLGQATPEYYRTSGLLPITGFMTFDSADMAYMAGNGLLFPVIVHEMGHVLGIGSMWAIDGLRSGSGFTGSHATFAYQLLSGNSSATSVPLETGGGSGTAGLHWSEAVFGNEVMTGYVAGLPDPLSTVTIGALQDMGYTVNYSAADAYTLPGHLVGGEESGSTDTNTTLLSPGLDNVGALGSAGSGTGGLALFVNTLASSFVPPAGGGRDAGGTALASDPEFLTKPVA